MRKLKTHILAASCAAIVGSIGFAADALAGPDVYGAGSSLVAPYIRQAMDCYALPTALITKATPPTVLSITPFNYVGSKPQDCSTTHTKTDRTLHYISTGSGTGIAGIFSHDPTLYGNIDPNSPPDPASFFPEVHFGLSDAGLAASDVSIYNAGGTEGAITVVGFGATPGAGQYGNPLQLFGPMVQFPVSIDPVAVAYDPVYKKVFSGGTVTSYKLNIHFKRTDGSGGLRLDSATYCAIFNGQITNWNDPALTALNGGKSLKDPTDTGPFSVPLQIVGRSDNSGTTSIFTRHLGNVCAGTGGNVYPTLGAQTVPSSLQGPTYDKTLSNNNPVSGETLGKFTRAAGSDGVAKYVAFTSVPDAGTPTIIQGRMAYVGPDYVLPAVTSTGANTYGLNSANLKNNSGQFEPPSAAFAANAFKVLSPPQSDASGHYDASNTSFGSRSNPGDWVQGLDSSSLLANPTVSGSYPMVGTTNFIGYTCYKTAAQKTTLIGFLSSFYSLPIDTDQKLGILAKAGLSPLPPAWRTAIKETFVNNTSGLGLNITTKGTGSLCSVSGIQGG